MSGFENQLTLTKKAEYVVLSSKILCQEQTSQSQFMATRINQIRDNVEVEESDFARKINVTD